jgi:hypothetical protein
MNTYLNKEKINEKVSRPKPSAKTGRLGNNKQLNTIKSEFMNKFFTYTLHIAAGVYYQLKQLNIL